MSNIVYVGGYQKADAFCLHCLEYTGSAFRLHESYEVSNASYICLSPDKGYLYAVIETDTFNGLPGGGVAAFGIEEGGKLRFINEAPTEGAHPCHLAVSGDGRSLCVANYTGGSTIFYDILADGSIGHKKTFINHNRYGAPSGVVASRQANPHAHFIMPKKIGMVEVLCICDLGLDMVLVLDDTSNELTRLTLPGGFGPRHIAFHPNLHTAYIVGELAQAVVAVDYTNTRAVKVSPAVPVSPDNNISCAAIRVSPDGRYLLVSNRGGGADSLSILELDDAGNVVRLSDVYMTRGRCPRDFDFTPKGDEIIVAYQDSDLIEVLSWDNGVLVPKAVEIALPKPTCVVFK
ncbi:MAG: lactonase family protein [Defluviitaleaceae bacterium]|nr:lactonase family protein [Defluviitaleaceae bacterium]